MKNLIIVFILIVSNHTVLKSADNYSVGDTLYVWAKSGLNIRTGPGVNHAIAGKLPLVGKVFVSKKTEKSYNVNGISIMNWGNNPKQSSSVIFKGHWVEVITSEGISGYVIDQYLLRYKPKSTASTAFYSLNLALIAVDTIQHYPTKDGEALIIELEKRYTAGITHSIKGGGVWSESIFTIPNATIEEILILFSASNYDYKNYSAERNWKEEINFRDDGICYFQVKEIENTVVFKIECSC